MYNLLHLPHITSNFLMVAMVAMVIMVAMVTVVMVIILALVVVVNMVVMVVRIGQDRTEPDRTGLTFLFDFQGSL